MSQLLTPVTALVLFLYAIESFGRELQQAFGERVERFIQRTTSRPLYAVLTGTIATAIIQSSTAVSVICISLVSVNSMSLAQAIPFLLGSNIGTTLTAQLVAFKLTGIGPFFIVCGFFLNLIKTKVSVWAKPLFYFGLLMFGLTLVRNELSELQSQLWFKELFLTPRNPYFGLLIGAGLTFVLQSSSVITAIIVVMVGQSLLPIEMAIALVIGANLGTTGTALLSSLTLNAAAKQAAVANFIINFVGFLLFAVLLLPFISLIKSLDVGPSQKVANAHLIFNFITVLVVYPLRMKVAYWSQSLISTTK